MYNKLRFYSASNAFLKVSFFKLFIDQSTMEKRATLQRCFMSKMERNELEDIYLRTHDENIILKKHGRKQEEKIKRLIIMSKL